MKFGCSIEMVNLRTSEPNRSQREAKYYWVELFKLVSAAGFKGIEMPFEPFNFRPGIPYGPIALKAKYGSVKGFVDYLNSIGIEDITGVHYNPSFTSHDLDRHFNNVETFAARGIDYAAELGAKTFIISASPEIADLENASKRQGNWADWSSSFLSKAAETLNKLGQTAAEKGIRLCVKNEYWGLARGNNLDSFMKQLDPKSVYYYADTSHIAIGKADPLETIRKYKERLGGVMFSDTAFEDKDDTYRKYFPDYPATGVPRAFSDPGLGKIDLKGIYEGLKGIGYDGWVTYSAKQTLNVTRALLRMRFNIDQVILKEQEAKI